MAVSRPLSRFLIRYEPPPEILDALRARFPEIEFLIASGASFEDLLPSADALLTWGLSAEHVSGAKRLKWVQWIGAGVEDAPLDALRRCGIVLTNNRGVHAINIAEHVMAMMLAFTRALPFLLESQSKRIWADEAGRKRVKELYGSTLLVVGSGQIGMALAQRGKAFGQQVTLIARTARPAAEGEFDVHPIGSLDDRLPAADHVALCLPLTAQTRGLFDSERLGRMKPGACLYNIGRGAVVVTDALTEALQGGHLGGAGLDVTDPEPLPPDHALWAMPNAMLTAHTAGATPNYWSRAAGILIDNIERFQSNRELRNVVNYELEY